MKTNTQNRMYCIVSYITAAALIWSAYGCEQTTASTVFQMILAFAALVAGYIFMGLAMGVEDRDDTGEEEDAMRYFINFENDGKHVNKYYAPNMIGFEA